MIVQIIFFLAVAMLIGILLWRGRQAGSSFDEYGTSESTVEIKNNFSQILTKIVSFVTGFVKSIGSRFERPEPISEISEGRTHQFWAQEAKEQQGEISSHLDEGDNLFKQGNLIEAERLYLKAAATRPEDPKPYAKLGRIYLEQKNFSDAIEALKLAAKMDKNNPSRHYNLALAYFGNNDAQKAIASVREAISLDPVTPKYRNLLDQLLDGQGTKPNTEAKTTSEKTEKTI